MGFTDNCNIFASAHEDGFNRIIYHVRRQRPSMFNYATQAVVDSVATDMANHQGILCKAIEAHEIFSQPKGSGQPLVTIIDPLPIPGTDYKLNFAAQVADLQIDFHPNNDFTLPPELNPPLAAQQWAGKLTLCGGVGCPEIDDADSIDPKAPPVLPADKLICFCIEAYVTGVITIGLDHTNNEYYIKPSIKGLEIVDIEPQELESGFECWLGLMLKLVVLPQLKIMLSDGILRLTQGAEDLFPQPTNVKLSPTPTSATLPNNPAIEEDLLKVFITAEILEEES